MKSVFLNASLGLSAALFAFGFLVRSFGTAEAAPSKERYATPNLHKVGKYMVMKVFDKDLLVWDTETGKSTYYIYSIDPKNRAITMKPYPLLPEKPVQ